LWLVGAFIGLKGGGGGPLLMIIQCPAPPTTREDGVCVCYSHMSGEVEESWPLLRDGWLVASSSFMMVFSNATTAILVNNSSIFSPEKNQRGREGSV